ncbi:zinc ribbon domain-containing protein [Kutzneria sp. NPDC051319]|uniref:zinc ribbon domain-containing protein n=1 Tax=Kutzneria sp. NPDC051319 TaxID=3155047 RepID=UPI003446D94E
MPIRCSGSSMCRSVDPAYTSQTCHTCGHVDKRNRRSQAVFHCGRCDFVGHADHNAALNTATRGAQRWGDVMRPDAAPILAASQDGSSKPTNRRQRRSAPSFVDGRVHDSQRRARRAAGGIG